jgi:hypothetical protein
MDTMVMQRRVVLRAGDRRARRHSAERAGWVAFAVAVLMLLALLPVYAGMASGRPADQAAPLAAPAPMPVTGIDFPEQAQPWGACTALLEHSGALDSSRSERADALTAVLFQDACFGA